MKKIKITFLRLLIIFEHFEQGKLYNDYKWYYEYLQKIRKLHENVGTEVSSYGTFPFVFRELPFLFSEWEELPFGVIICNKTKNIPERDALISFLGLTKKEFEHLFVPMKQMKEFGGTTLFPDSTPKQIANNIADFLSMQIPPNTNRLKDLDRPWRENMNL